MSETRVDIQEHLWRSCALTSDSFLLLNGVLLDFSCSIGGGSLIEHSGTKDLEEAQPSFSVRRTFTHAYPSTTVPTIMLWRAAYIAEMAKSYLTWIIPRLPRRPYRNHIQSMCATVTDGSYVHRNFDAPTMMRQSRTLPCDVA